MTSVILQDVNHVNPCEFPKGLSDTAVIENPCNKDEILIFGGYKSNDIYIYNKNKNTIKKNHVSIANYNYGVITCAYVVSGNRKNTVIVLCDSRYSSCYRVFDCEKMDFDEDINERANNFGEKKTGVRVADGSSIQRWNNLLFIFGHNGITVYDVKDEYFPKKIEFSHWKSLLQKSTFRTFHKSFIVESNMENKNKVHLKFLMFGAHSETCFNDSFYQIDVDIDIDSNNNNNNDYKININCDNDAKDWKIPQDIAEKYNYDSKVTFSSAHWYKSRYLIIVGGYHFSQKKASDKIICFDYKKKKWYVGDEEEEFPMYKMPMGLLGHTSLLQQENDDLYLYVFGGCINIDYDTSSTKTCWKLKLTTQMDWKIERIIWIGYMKNQDKQFQKGQKNTNVCHLARLSKDVVKFVLSFLQPRLIFE